ncbi:hypothetical protein E3P92_02074 [Wallemia ichthyophaga]|uniref:Heat shock protein hsp88 n=2 Tax=Wallemia ichthyophaga TaxID=245174 RepID=A0A4T0L5H6_WALIC|nr:Heat shock protein Hsp88 [Wallemia ichthyophaga EXF-994]TIA72138.1 hypothetical protein E3P91_02167 [Wallemia ichthyophaga]EOQ99889.1 Heat shock protein Hsp88 [Wallemia ichthyophaga EXF-994]TIA84537.1 hypothetical protein E3P98_00093 [Wallemia ichthyophaga]TIB12766.1 hypothetical protein E3P90_01864 [Wallemia ichthyophaga]TIB14197.1 hypothetical protein E3P92_02074 [Wallemia ichthyophaga]
MSVVGLDIGNFSSTIACARSRGIDIICNEVSNRSTPTMAGFNPKSRTLGEAAKSAETSNFKNTASQLKRLIGRAYADSEVQAEQSYIGAPLVDAGGEVGVEASLAGEKQAFSATQLMAMYLGKLRDTAQQDIGTKVSDVVVSVPGWFTDAQRRAMLDASKVAGLNSLRVMNDLSATALGYGITKPELPEQGQPPRHVVFVDAGHSNFQVSVVAFNKGTLEVKGAAYNRHLGGRNLDKVLTDHFVNEFKGKYKIDVYSNPKATFRLAAGCERLKKVLSANSVAPLNVENLMNDIDATSMLKREEFEAAAADVLKGVEAPLAEALQAAGIEQSQVDAVELVGGTSRVPAIKEKISQFFGGKTLSTTLNQDEAVVRGATLACAMLSPVFRVREFSVNDINLYGIKATWDAPSSLPAGESNETEIEAFPTKNAIPSTKILTFYRKEAFDIHFQYSNPSALPTGINPWISKATIKDVAPTANGDFSIVKVKVRLNLHGLVSVEGAYTVEEVEGEEQVPVQVGEGEEPKTETRKVNRTVKKQDLTVIGGTTGASESVLATYHEKEGQMYAHDKLVAETEERKNALEEYVYDQRNKLDDRHAAYATPEEKETFKKALGEAEDWLYTDEGEDAQKSAYVSRLDSLKKLGDPIVNRYREQQELPKAAAVLREATNDFLTKAQSGDERYSHIAAEDIQKVIDTAANAAKWLDDNMYKQSEKMKTENPVITSTQVLKTAEEIGYTCNSILNRPKPKPKTEAPAPEPQPAKEGETQKDNMDVD